MSMQQDSRGSNLPLLPLLSTVTLQCCAGSGRDGVDFLHSSLYGAGLCICGQTASVVDTPAFWLLPNNARTLSRLSLQLPPPKKASGLGMGKSLGGDNAETADPN